MTDREVMSSGDANVTIEVKIEEGSGGKRGQLIVKGQSMSSLTCVVCGVKLINGRYRYRDEQG